MNKEENGNQDVGATAFDLPNSEHPGYPNNIYYGNQHVPHPTNSHAKTMGNSADRKQMQCTKCKYPESHVVRTEHDDLKNLLQRRRECLRCGARFTTHEKMREDKKPIDDRYPARRDI